MCRCFRANASTSGAAHRRLLVMQSGSHVVVTRKGVKEQSPDYDHGRGRGPDQARRFCFVAATSMSSAPRAQTRSARTREQRAASVTQPAAPDAGSI